MPKGAVGTHEDADRDKHVVIVDCRAGRKRPLPSRFCGPAISVIQWSNVRLWKSPGLETVEQTVATAPPTSFDNIEAAAASTALAMFPDLP
ncbi:MAG: hypothetical protein U0992_10340 [Planctomycetaceae bacterium]